MCSGSLLIHFHFIPFGILVGIPTVLINIVHVCMYVLLEFEFEFHVLSEIGVVPTKSVHR